MPLWARCGARDVNRNDHEGPETGGDQETTERGGQGGGMLEGLVRNVASLISDAVWGYFKPAQNQKQTCTQPCDAADLPTLQIESAEEIPQPSQANTLSDAAAIESLAPAEVAQPSSPLSDKTSVNDGEAESSGQTMPDRACLKQEHSSSQSKSRECLDGVDDIDEVLSSTLGALYGRATPAVVKQAWEVLSDSYGGNVSRFKSEYLTPVLELLHKVQEIQDTGEVPNSTWPLSVGSSVVVHLSRTNCRYLQDIGDFCISAVLDKPHGHPAIIVSSLTFDGVAEREVDEPDYGLLLTMDWARRIREATDRELVFLLRQCMVASEYSVRHLRWDEIPHLDPRNLNNTTLHLVLSDIGKGNGNANSSSLPSSSDSEPKLTRAHLTAGVHEDQKDDSAEIGLLLPGCCLGESDSGHFALSDNLAARRALDDTVINTKADQNCRACSDHSLNPLHSKQCPSGNAVCPESLDALIPFDVCDRTDCKVVQQETPSPQLSAHKDNSPSLSRSLHQQSSTLSPSSQIRAQSKHVTACSPTASSLSGGNYYGTWHGNRKGSHAQKRADGGAGNRSSVAAADVGDSSVCCHHRHVSSSSRRAPEAEHLNNPRDCQDNMVDGLRSAEPSSCSSASVHRSLEAPALISQVDSEILSSGVAILPGCVDEDGRCLVYIFTCSSLWHERRVSSTELARLLMYYYSVPRKKPSQKGMAIVADIRGVTPSTINVLLEALNLFQENIPGSVAVVHLFADKSAQACVIKSPLYDARAHVNLKVVLSLDHLQQYVNPTQIPTVLDGDYPYNHESWVRFQKKLEAFMSSCRTVACRLVDAMQEISSCEHMPQSVAESADMIRAHDQMVKLAFEDEKLLTLQSDGPGIMSALMREEELFAHSEDYRYAMEQATELYQDLQETVARLARLADEHMTKLHNCLQLREYEDECHKVIDWLSQDGETILQRHATTADNLKAARHQQKDFEKFYYSAVSYIEKGNDLLEEASMLSQCGSFSEATGYKDLAKTLRRQLQNFTGQLEEARERIEGTAKCYHLLDKSYEWALEAMKYMSSMKMEHSTTAEGLDKLLKSLSIYLSEHPAISEETFVAMLEAAQRLNNDRLLEQCRLAKARCQETHKLLQLRHATLRRARIQMGGEQVVNEDPRDKNPSLYSVHIARVMEAPLVRQHSQTDRTNNVDLTQNLVPDSPSLFTPPSSVKGIASEARAQSGDAVCPNSPWQPQDSSTPTFSDLQSTCDGPQVTPVMGFKSKNRSDHALRVSIGAAPFFHTQAESASLCSTDSLNSSPTKIPFSASFSSPLSSSSTQYVPTSISLPVSPTLSASEAPARSRLYQPPSLMSRVYNSSTRISAPSVASDPARPTARRPLPNAGSVAAASTTAPARPHKKILKRASTAPIPMLTSPILEEDAGPFGHSSVQAENSGSRSEGSGARDQRSSKSLSVITSSTESLPSMPEEDEEEADLNMSPSRDHQDLSSGSSVKDWTPVPVNTHLHRSARGTPTGPMADLNLSEAEMKSRRTVSLIMSEMIQTERDYVRALQFITDHYVPELQRDDVPQMLRGKRTVIFGNLEKIHQFHSHYFLKQLESCQNQPFLVGQYFLQHETMFYLYALYNKNKPKSDCLMTEYGKEFFRQKQLELGDKMDLSSYLLKPVQRMGKYALLLKQLLKECSETELEYPELKAAEEMVKFQLRHGNDLLAMDSLRDCDVNLQEQGRLLRQEEFLVFQGRKKSMRQIFLFEDLILFSKTRRGRQGQHDIYIYKTSFKTADIGLTENYGESGYKFEIWFRRRSVGENYVLQAPSSEVKKAWVKDISRLLWRQAIRNRESRINELATMGIGNKPCLDIKPSEDNIQDRSVNVALANRGARTRNSIAVSSFDYLRNGNKRPHSIISVSSTSSSGSSQSSFGLLGSLNLAFDPLDSPRMNRRSFISNESGIATDSDASACDLGVENKGPTPSHTSQSNVASLNTVRSYFDVMKSRVLKQKFSDQLFTDV